MDDDISMINPLPNRRMKPRSVCDYEAIVNGCDAIGGAFTENARIVNISAGGAFLYLYRPIMVETVLSLKVTVPASENRAATSARATNAQVVRCASYPIGIYGVAVKFK